MVDGRETLRGFECVHDSIVIASGGIEIYDLKYSTELCTDSWEWKSTAENDFVAGFDCPGVIEPWKWFGLRVVYGLSELDEDALPTRLLYNLCHSRQA